MKNSFLKYSTILAVVLLLAGCPPVPVRNVNDASLGSEGHSLEEVGQAIKRAGRGLGWDMQDKGGGKIRGTLNIRTHRAVVMIGYNTKTFNINYVDSTNLDYNAGNNEIHRAYDGWIQNLETAIRLQMSE
jgi:hypothetical protein